MATNVLLEIFIVFIIVNMKGMRSLLFTVQLYMKVLDQEVFTLELLNGQGPARREEVHPITQVVGCSSQLRDKMNY